MDITRERFTNNGLFPIRYQVSKGRPKGNNKNLNRGFKTLGISDQTMRKIKHCARTLTFLAPERKVRNSKGDIFLHKIAFVTLTLCAEQSHDDQFITKELLGMFLDRARKLGLLSNYVWRAEKQANGNIHYHILTDTYAPFSIFNRLWALVQSKYGYLQRYREKFKAMSFDEYKNQPFNKKRQLTDISRAYARGVRNGWTEPPSCQVDYTNNTTELELYLSKYMSKDIILIS